MESSKSQLNRYPRRRGLRLKRILQTIRALVPAVTAVVLACAEGELREPIPTTLRVQVIPDQSEAVLRSRYAPLLAYLKTKTGLDCELTVPASYAEALDVFARRAVDLAYFGGVTFVRAHRIAGATPFVMRAQDLRFTTVFLVRAGEPARSLEELHNRRIAFGSRLSTSGHWMPRQFLMNWNMKPETFFSEVHYTGAHDATADWVRDGKVDVGAANAQVVTRMLQDGRLKPGEVRILRESPPYADYVWAVQPGLHPELRARLRDAFLALSLENTADAEVLKKLDATYFLPARLEDFQDLTTILDEIESGKAGEGV